MNIDDWSDFLLRYRTESKLLKGTNSRFKDRRLLADLDEEYLVKIYVIDDDTIQVGVYRDESWYNFQMVETPPATDELDKIILELVDSLSIDEHLYWYRHY